MIPVAAFSVSAVDESSTHWRAHVFFITEESHCSCEAVLLSDAVQIDAPRGPMFLLAFSAEDECSQVICCQIPSETHSTQRYESETVKKTDSQPYCQEF